MLGVGSNELREAGAGELQDGENFGKKEGSGCFFARWLGGNSLCALHFEVTANK
jgi:hypothetical protein